MNCSMPGLPLHHQLPEFTQTHVHRVGDAIQPSHPLSSPSPPAPNPSQHQGLFQWVNSSHEVAKVLEFQLQHQFFQWSNFRLFKIAKKKKKKNHSQHEIYKPKYCHYWRDGKSQMQTLKAIQRRISQNVSSNGNTVYKNIQLSKVTMAKKK